MAMENVSNKGIGQYDIHDTRVTPQKHCVLFFTQVSKISSDVRIKFISWMYPYHELCLLFMVISAQSVL